MEGNFVLNVSNDYYPEIEENIKDSLFIQYKRVVIESLLTSFGLDSFIRDQHGGDVDTIYNVRKIGIDQEMNYKNKINEEAYINRSSYDFKSYHNNSNFKDKKHEAREMWKQNGENIKDEYGTGTVGFYGKSKTISPNKKAELDHNIECKGIHDDRGRVLSELSGVELANSNENLIWTNKSLNASMGAWAKNINEEHRRKYGCDAPLEKTDMKAYVEAHPNLDVKVKRNMLNQYNKAKKTYEAKINTAYYTSSKFRKDLFNSSTKVGIQMGTRQAFGFLLSEIVFTVMEEFETSNKSNSLSEICLRVSEGVKKGFERAKEKYRNLIEKFKTGFLSGMLASLTTTLTNIFFTTSKSIVKIIRQIWASLVEALKILFLNPDNLLFGERMRAVLKLITTGASIIVGTLVSESIGKLPVIANCEFGEVIKIFCGTLVTGVMSCSLLYFLDKNSLVNKLVNFLNELPTMSNLVNYYKQQAKYFEEYAAKLMEIDIESFRKEVLTINRAVSKLEDAKTDVELNNILKEIYRELNFELPWKGDFDKDFMSNKNNVLIFK